MKQGGPRRRSKAEKAAADLFHAVGRALNGGKCVKCGGPAGWWAHHVVPKGWLYHHSRGLRAAMWDPRNAAPICFACHEGETLSSRPVTRGELRAAGVWDRVVEWAKRLDAELFPDPVHQPVLSRLEREYPA